jgi:integrase
MRFKVYDGLNNIKNEKARRKFGIDICNEIAQKLKLGWSPFEDDLKVIYEDQIGYDKITRIYGKKRADNKTIRYYGSKYIEYIMPTIDPEGTLPTYQSKIRIFCMWIDSRGKGEDCVTTIVNETIIEFFKWLIDDQKRSRKTVGTYRQVLQNMFEWLIKQRVFISNPVHDTPNTIVMNDQSPSPIHNDDISVFKEAMSGDEQLWLAAQFQFYCALRPGKELRLLKIKNIDFGRGLITVNRTQAKTRVTRTVVVPDVFLRKLRNDYKLQTYDKEFYVFGKDKMPGPENLGKNNLRFRFNKIRDILGMPFEYKFYSWKHTGGVAASLAGVPDKHIQMQMGHTSLATTEKYLRKMAGFQSDHLKHNYPSI